MVITSLAAFDTGAPWPIPSEQNRMDTYATNALLYEGKHVRYGPTLTPSGLNRPALVSMVLIS